MSHEIIITNAISDTCLFVIGAFIGTMLNFSIKQLYYIDMSKTALTILGLGQLTINAMIIHITREKTTNLGFFTMGLLSYQDLVFKKIASSV